MNVINNDDKELPPEKKTQGPEEPLEKEIIEIKPQEETKGVPLEEKPVPPAETTPPSKEEIKPKIRRKSKPKRKLKPKPQIPEMTKKWEDKWVDVDGKKVLFVPSGFEIMTKNGWRPIMTRADNIKR